MSRARRTSPAPSASACRIVGVPRMTGPVQPPAATCSSEGLHSVVLRDRTSICEACSTPATSSREFSDGAVSGAGVQTATGATARLVRTLGTPVRRPLYAPLADGGHRPADVTAVRHRRNLFSPQTSTLTCEACTQKSSAEQGERARLGYRGGRSQQRHGLLRSRDRQELERLHRYERNHLRGDRSGTESE